VERAKEEREDEEAREAAQREARRMIGGEGEDPAVAAVLRALEQCVFLGMRRKEFHGEEEGEEGREGRREGGSWLDQASYFSQGGREGGREKWKWPVIKIVSNFSRLLSFCEMTGVLPFWKMVWTVATGCLQLPHGHHPAVRFAKRGKRGGQEGRREGRPGRLSQFTDLMLIYFYRFYSSSTTGGALFLTTVVSITPWRTR